MKIVRVYTGDDGESHLDITDEANLTYVERDGTRTAVQDVSGAQFAMRKEGSFSDFHNAPHSYKIFRLTAFQVFAKHQWPNAQTPARSGWL